MSREFKLPDLGEGIHEAEIREILVSVGDEVAEDADILVVETDKAVVDIPSPYGGTVTAINVESGDWVSVGDTLITFDDEEEGAATKVQEAPEAEPPEPQQEPQAQEKAPEPPKGRPVPASPATRRLARELGVDLREAPASGPSGRVTSEDVRAFAEQETEPKKGKPQKGWKERAARPLEISAPELPDFTLWGEVERVPVRSVRREIARQMTLSWSQIPHVTHQDRVDITDLERLRNQHKAEIAEAGGSLTLTIFVMKALVTALKAYPRFNASFDPGSGEIVLKRYYHVGVAVDTDRGLIVPVIRDVERKSIRELAIELQDLVTRTRAGEATLEEMQGGTFTITNVGVLGGASFAPIINFPEVAILGMARARWQPVVRPSPKVPDQTGPNLDIAPRFMLPLILTFDHRVLDGADAGRFMRTLVEMLEDPERLLLNIA
ncbi:MAG: 2-oxo acid dehydrogenase subunit E2 [Anaerolineae bacterium]|nr:2-oxo acid dehydrogenase subunit E2 [Anaerolineae bacterium]